MMMRQRFQVDVSGTGRYGAGIGSPSRVRTRNRSSLAAEIQIQTVSATSGRPTIVISNASPIEPKVTRRTNTATPIGKLVKRKAKLSQSLRPNSRSRRSLVLSGGAGSIAGSVAAISCALPCVAQSSRERRIRFSPMR